jgi:hypothetical protein
LYSVLQAYLPEDQDSADKIGPVLIVIGLRKVKLAKDVASVYPA